MVYCDIPYNSKTTKGSYGLEFDHETFYQWALTQNETVVFSDYLENVPADFEVIWSKNKTNKLAGGASKKSTEILAWNKKGTLIQTTLF